MTQFIELLYKNKDGKTYKTQVIHNKSNYINAKKLFDEADSTIEAFLINNNSRSLQLQFDLQNAPQLFVISIDENNNKKGISVNYLVSESPYSIMLSEKKYLVVPYLNDLDPQGIVKIIESSK